MENDLTVDRLVEINESIENENSTIRAGDEIIITVPEPELSVERQEEVYYEEDYEAEIIYVDNDDWYTTESKTLQEPSAGHRKVVAVVSYRNNLETAREIVKEEVTYEAVPKIVERGTKIPPTYIKPISGGRLSSGFGKRSRPTRGPAPIIRASTGRLRSERLLWHLPAERWQRPAGEAAMVMSFISIMRMGGRRATVI